MVRMRGRTLRFAALLAAGLSAAAASGSAQAATGYSRVGRAPQIPAGSSVVGSLASGTSLSVAVTLEPSDASALAAYAQSVSTPGSADYRHYLTVSQFRAQFAPSAAQISSVEGALRSAGLTPGSVSADGLSISVSGTASQLSTGFNTSLERVRLHSGRVAYTNTEAPRVASSVARIVQGVVGLSSLARAEPVGYARATTSEGDDLVRPSDDALAIHSVTDPTACSAASSAADGAYTADQIASAYGFTTLFGDGDLGSGASVGLIELEPNSVDDIATYDTCYGVDPTINYTQVDGGAGGGDGSGEAAFDIEQVAGLAPESTIDVFQAPNTNAGLLDDYRKAIVNGVKVISTSWGECESDNGDSMTDAEQTLFEEAATEGISVFAASGDDGSTDCFNDDSGPGQPPQESSGLAVDDPGSDPYVTSVGGTSLPSLTAPSDQSVWDNAEGASGGGISSVWTMPTYQQDASSTLDVISSQSSSTTCEAPSGTYCREVPDVSADADPDTGYVIYWNGDGAEHGDGDIQGWQAIGGTSGAAPLWAALTADADSSTACNGTSIGFMNPALYTVASNATSYADDFTDVASGTNDYSASGYTGGLYPAVTGYDMATGLGTPLAAALAPALCADPTSSTTTSGSTFTPVATTTTTATPTTTTPSTTTTTTSTTPTSPSTSTTPGSTAEGCVEQQLLPTTTFSASSAARKITTLSQTITLPTRCAHALLALAVKISTNRKRGAKALDDLRLQVLSSSGKLLRTLTTLSNRNASSVLRWGGYNLGSYVGDKVALRLRVTGAKGGRTTFTVKLLALEAY